MELATNSQQQQQSRKTTLVDNSITSRKENENSSRKFSTRPHPWKDLHTQEGDDDATTWRSKDEGKKELGSLGMSFFFFLFFLQETGKVFRPANRSKFRLAREVGR
jgi:hypothetical protein